MAERPPAYVLGILDGLHGLGLEPPEEIAQAVRTRTKLEEAHRKAQRAAAEVSTASLRSRFESEAVEAAESDREMPDYSAELARLEAEQRWRKIAVDALDDAISAAGYRVVAAVASSMDEIYEIARGAWAVTLDRIRATAPTASALSLENPESILRNGDRKAINAFATLSDAADALGKLGTLQRHLRTAQDGDAEASAHYDHFEDPSVSRQAPKHRLSYALWLVSPGVNPVFRTVEESRAKQAERDQIQRGRRAAATPGAVFVP